MENNVLVLDDKISQINNLINSDDPVEQNEGNSLKSVMYGIKNNDLTPVPIENITDIVNAQKQISSVKNVKGIVLDLNLNSMDGVEQADIELIKILLKTVKENFGNFFVFVLSSEADQWESVRKEIEAETPELIPILKRTNTKVIEKGRNKESIINMEIHELNEHIKKQEAQEIVIESKIIMCKSWITEWVFTGIAFSLVNLLLLIYNALSSYWHYLTLEIGIVIIITKAIQIEIKRIEALRKFKNTDNPKIKLYDKDVAIY